MLKYKVGDVVYALQSGEVEAIGHQANCFNTMNSGVAKAIKARLPCAWNADQLTVKGDRGKLGTISVGRLDDIAGNLSGLVYNLYGQYNYGYDDKGYTNYEALRGALIHMCNDLREMGFTHVGFPKIGAGLGGGDWDTIAGIIEEVFADYDITIYVLRESDVPERDQV